MASSTSHVPSSRLPSTIETDEGEGKYLGRLNSPRVGEEGANVVCGFQRVASRDREADGQSRGVRLSEVGSKIPSVNDGSGRRRVEVWKLRDPTKVRASSEGMRRGPDSRG